jgi:hypothetical protein
VGARAGGAPAQLDLTTWCRIHKDDASLADESTYNRRVTVMVTVYDCSGPVASC